MITKRALTRWSGLLAAAAILFAACSTAPGGSAAPSAAPGGSAVAGAGGPSEELIAAAKAEGTLSTIALPHDWCNYGEMIEGFKAKYGLAVNELNPDAGSGDEIEAIKANKENPGPQAPDVIDVGITFGEPAKTDGLIQAYKVSTFDTIDEEFKDPEGFWYGDYYSILTFEVNKAAVPNTPQDWPDLLKPEYKNQIALAGDPRASSQAINAVYAASLASGGSLDDAGPGLDFFKQLNDAGNFVPTIAKPGTIDTGATPITIRWAYNALGHKDQAAGNPEIEVVVPTSGRFLGAYVQAISAYAPHPNAAKLWMEYLYSDEGQGHWLKGYCHTTRLADLTARGVHADLIAKLPDIEGAVYPTAEQASAASTLITGQWDSVVGADVVE